MPRLKVKITIEEVNSKKFIYRGISEDKEVFANTINAEKGICEFIGAMHGFMFIKKSQLYGDVFVENKYIKESIENKSYKHETQNEREKDLLRRAKLFLLDMKSNINIYLYE